jgi:hypothetical protein
MERYRENSQRSRLTPAPTIVATLLYVSIFVGGRVVLARRLVGLPVTFRAALTETLVALVLLCLGALLYRIRPILGTALLFVLGFGHIVNMEMVSSLQSVLRLQELTFGVGHAFFQGSISRPIFLWYGIVLGVATLFVIASWYRHPLPPPRTLVVSTLALLGVLVIFTPLFVRGYAGQRWEVSSLLWATAAQTTEAAFSSGSLGSSVSSAPESQAPGGPVPSTAAGTSEETMAALRRDYNVLILVLEGMAGPYLRQVQEATGVDYPVVMDKLSDFAEDAVVIPNVVSHNRQTIRGLYPILTGDYPEFTLTTPRAYQYMALPEEEKPTALPFLLTAAGYQTVFLQAAELTYMSKDYFMESVGFERVLGSDYFDQQYIDFGWGPDDQAFFEGAFDMIESLDDDERPWLLTLLNVGTHHPYAVPDEMLNEYPSERIAAVYFLDQVLGEFLTNLEDGGYLEDTVVVVTSDESHGVVRQPFGRYWPLAVIRTPETEPSVNSARYGLIDVPWTLLDFLGLSEEGELIHRRSMLEPPEEDRRPLLFERFASPYPGVIYELLGNERIKIYRPENGVLYAAHYDVEVPSRDSAKRILTQVEAWREEASGTLDEPDESEESGDKYVLIENGEYELAPGETASLTSGQYLDFPEGSGATVEIVAEMRGSEENTSGDLVMELSFLRQGEDTGFPELRLPALSHGERLEYSASFNTEESVDRVSAVLTAKNTEAEEVANLNVRRVTVILGLEEVEEAPEGYRENRGVVADVD